MLTCFQDAQNVERYLRWTHGLIVVYSVTNRRSFDTALDLLEQVMQCLRQMHKELPVILVANKIDLERYR